MNPWECTLVSGKNRVGMRNTGQQRRRRVVNHEVAQLHGQSELASTGSGKTGRSRSVSSDVSGALQPEGRTYTQSANRRHQKKTTDLIPKRFLSCALVMLALLSAIAGLNFLAANAGNWSRVIGDAGVQAASIGGSGTLSNWFKSFLLIITGLASLQIFALRQHRCDDYSGSYRLWLWMSALLFVASMNCVVDLRQIAINISGAFVSSSIGTGVWTIAIVKLVALAALVIRGLVEVRQSKSAVGLILLVWVAWSAAALMQIPAVHESTVLDQSVTRGNLVLFGTVALFLGHLFYARFVYLTAQGLVASAVHKKNVKVKKKTKAAQKTKTPKSATRKSKPATPELMADETDEVSESGKSTSGKSSTKNSSKPVSKSKRAKKKTKVADEIDLVPDKSKPSAGSRRAVPKPSRPPVPKPTQNIPMKPRAEIRDDANEQTDSDSQILSMSSTEPRKLTRAERKRLQKAARKNRRAA